MLLIGLNTGLRIGDIVPLKVKDIRSRSHISIIEQKTNKAKRFPVASIKYELDKYIEGMDNEDFLFTSRQVNSEGVKSHITTTQAYRALKKIADSLDIKEFGTHSCRKSFGYHYYNKTKDIAKLMNIFNHSSQSVTLNYIGMTQESIDESLEGFYL
jgi:integrase